MAETVHQNPLARLKAIPFDRAVNFGIGLSIAAFLLLWLLELFGVSYYSGHFSLLRKSGPATDPLFISLYTAFALLLFYNLLLFYQYRAQLYGEYVYYIVCVILHIAFYERVFVLVGIDTPFPLDVATGLAVIYLGMIWLLRFARTLLHSRKRGGWTDLILRIGIVTAFSSVVIVLAAPEYYWISDLAWTSAFGTALLILSLRLAAAGNRVALLFASSWLVSLIGYYSSYVFLLWPGLASMASTYLLPYDDPDRWVSLTWLAGLALEALLMSVAAQLHVRESRWAVVSAERRADRLDQALKKAKSQLADAARRAQTQDGLSQTKSGGMADLAPVLRRIIEDNAAETFVDVAFLASATATSKATLLRRLKQETGLSPNAFIRETRLDLAHRLLQAGRGKTVGEIHGRCGFSNRSHFTRRYQDRFGESPHETLKSARNPAASES